MEQEVETLDAEVLVRFIAKKGWAEKNFQVCNMIILFDDGDTDVMCRCRPRCMESSLLWPKKVHCLGGPVVRFVYPI